MAAGVGWLQSPSRNPQRRFVMPNVRIELYAGRTPEQKAACARDIVDAVVRNLGAPPDVVQVVFVDVERHDWHTGGRIPPPASAKA